MTKRRYVTTWDENRLQHDGVDSNVAKVICYIGCSGLCDCGARGVCKPANWLASWTACGATQLNNVGANFLFAINFHPTANIQNLHR